MKKQHQYTIRIEHVQNPDGTIPQNGPLEFAFSSHDELFSIVDKLKDRSDITQEEAAPLGLGIKLFGSVMLANRKSELFASLFPHFASFMKTLKQKAVA